MAKHHDYEHEYGKWKKQYNDERGVYPYHSEDTGFRFTGTTSNNQSRWYAIVNTPETTDKVETDDISLVSDLIKFTYDPTLPDDYTPTMQDHAYNIVDEAVDILISKHEDYGPLNILNAPGGVYNGLTVRLHDKISRLANLTKTGNEPNHESLRDTLIDIINYAVIGILVSEGHWE